MNRQALANRLWLLAGRSTRRRFHRAVHHLRATQARYLLRLIRKNAETEYGRTHGFGSISSVAEYTRNVPLTEYEDYAPYIESIARGAGNVLTRDPVELFEPSSGSTSATKLIPYTASLRREFQRAIRPWLGALYHEHPRIIRGRTYWAISPPTDRERFHGVVSVGFDDDSRYLGALGRRVHRMVSIVPGECPDDTDASWAERTLVHLVAARDLALLSVWSPTFLTSLVRRFASDPPNILSRLRKSGLPNAASRASEVEHLLHHPDGLQFERIWPHLAAISCWTHGPSALYAEGLQELFPNVPIQPKGLLATEAFVSFPLVSGRDPVLAATSHFFEFQEVDSGAIRLAHELETGKHYSVIATTGGGLYRYRLHDIVEVTGHFHQDTPELRFTGRDNQVSDLFGEKLNAVHVRRCIDEALAHTGITPTFYLLAPDQKPDGTTGYTLFLEAPNLPQAAPPSLAAHLETQLRNNFHYNTCRKLGQLAPATIFTIDTTQETATEIYTKEMKQRGIKLGNIKPKALDTKPVWRKAFSSNRASST